MFSVEVSKLYAAKFLRTFVYSALGILLGVYLVFKGLTLLQVGLVFSGAVLGSTVSTLGTPHLLRVLGLRRTSIALPLIITLSGTLLMFGDNLYEFFIAVLIGSVSITQTEAGGFLVLDQTMLPEFTRGSGVTGAFSAYNLSGYFGSSAGGAATLILGRLMPENVELVALIGIYTLSGLVLSVIYYLIPTKGFEEKFAQSSSVHSVMRSNPVIAKLSSLFALDAFAGGLTTQSWVSYWFSARYLLSLSTLGLIFFISNTLSALSLVLAPFLARRLGLVRVMVFTHLPSNILLMLVPLGGSALGSAAFYFARQTLSQIDVPTRQALVVSLVKAKDRAGAASVTTAVRGVAQMFSTPLTGRLLSLALYGTPFFTSGGLKSAYDIAVFYTMRNRLDLGVEPR